MKKENFLRGIALLATLILTVTTTFSNYNFVKAAETTADTQVDKELVQCDSKDGKSGWVIFKYKDSEGTPQFDITYNNKTAEELTNEGMVLTYKILPTKYIEINDLGWHEFNNSVIQDEIYSYNYTILIQFSLLGPEKNYGRDEISRSDAFALCDEDKKVPHILSTNIDYFESYDLTCKSNKLNLKVKFDEPLEQEGNLSITSNTLYNEINSYLQEHPISNLSFENYEDTYTVNGKDYTIEYSIVNFDIELLPAFVLTPTPDLLFIEYTLTLNGLKGIYTNKNVDIFHFFAMTPFRKTTIPDQPKDILVQSIKISAPSAQVKAGKTINLNASVNSDATNKSIVWSSSNTKYATVNSNGIVTAKAAGAGKTVIITAKATDGSGKIATFKLKISKVSVSKIKLKAKKSVKVGKKLKIKLTINSDATNKAVKWSVNNKKYAKINSKGVLTAKKAGKGKTVKVTAKAKDGSGKKATIKIKIKK